MVDVTATILAALQIAGTAVPDSLTSPPSLGAVSAVPLAAMDAAVAGGLGAAAPPTHTEAASVAALVRLVRRSHSAAEQLSAAEALCQLAQGSAAVQTAIVAAGGVQVLLRRLGSRRLDMRRAAATVLLHLAVGSAAQLALIESLGGTSALQSIRLALLDGSNGMEAPLVVRPQLGVAAAGPLSVPAAASAHGTADWPPAALPATMLRAAAALAPQHVAPAAGSDARIPALLAGLQASDSPAVQLAMLGALSSLVHASAANGLAIGIQGRGILVHQWCNSSCPDVRNQALHILAALEAGGAQGGAAPGGPARLNREFD